MQLGLRHEIIETTVIIELSLIVALIFFTYFTRYVLYFREKRRKKLTAQIENYLNTLMTTNQPINVKKFRRRFKKIQILYPLFVKFEQTQKDNSDWALLRKDFLQNILLPLARRRAFSRRWLIRFFACETLSISGINSLVDERIILRLVKDRVPLIYMHAINVAINSGSEAAIKAIIARMAKMSWLTQSMYLEPFEHAPIETRHVIEQQLISVPDENIRSECYKILRKFPAVKITWDINKDLKAPQFELRLSALKYLVYADPEAALPALIEKVKDEHWEIRLAAVHRLGRLKTVNVLPQLADCLNDHEWWVKISAAEALKSLGAEGEALLKERAPDLATIPFEITQHISNTLW